MVDEDINLCDDCKIHRGADVGESGEDVLVVSSPTGGLIPAPPQRLAEGKVLHR